MNLFKPLVEIGIKNQNTITQNKHIRFTNSIALIVCFFIVQNIILSIYYKQSLIASIQLVHLIMIAIVPFFNYKSKPIFAAAWFSSVAIFFVTIYSIIFTLEGFNFIFLPLIIFVQFFLFSSAEKMYVIIFVTATTLCFAGVLFILSSFETLALSLPQGFIYVQRWNTLAGVPLLCAAFGAYAFSTINKAEYEVAREKDDLKAAQRQLIQTEKMASLGELTAGIAHEIQNPLNFVNNFSEVNTELVSELEEAANKGNLEEVKSIAKGIKDNEQKIVHHGKRADAIVKGMLQHSRASSGTKEPTDINVLADEYLRLAYHGLRAKDKSFNAKFETDFDNSLEKINVVPQDIVRVVLNLITNAFYAVSERALRQARLPDGQAQGDSNYEPTVIVSTKKEGDKVLILVKDNGNGISDSIKEKIFQPFFTTKPTGQGTGLGLSLSYDIVKAHGGELKVETKVGESSEFIIQLPLV